MGSDVSVVMRKLIVREAKSTAERYDHIGTAYAANTPAEFTPSPAANYIDLNFPFPSTTPENIFSPGQGDRDE